MQHGGRTNPRRQLIHAVMALGAIITLVWIVSFTVDMLDPDYEAPASVQALMMLVAGAAFGSGFWTAIRGDLLNGNGNGKHDDPDA